MCEAQGLSAYEVSNHSKPGEESRHNLIYWSGGDFVGIGPGAHGRLTLGGSRFATETWLTPNRWLEQAIAGNGESKRVRLSRHDHANEYMMMGLRTSGGILLDRVEALLGRPMDIPDQLIDADLVYQEGSRLVATLQGRMVLNHVIQELLI